MIALSKGIIFWLTFPPIMITNQLSAGSKMKNKYRLSIPLVLVALFLGQIAVNSARAEIIRGPYLSDVPMTSIVVSWETPEASGSIVEYGTSEGAYDKQAEEAGNVKKHSVTLRNLMQSTSYHYRVVSDSDVGADNTFHTAVDWFEPFTFVAYGDTRTNPADHQAVVNSIIEHEPALVLHSGGSGG